GKPERLMSCDCERSEDAGLLQAFQLITGELLDGALRDPENGLGKMMAAGRSDGEIVQALFLASLGRHPSDAERSKLAALLGSAAARRLALEDVAWGVLNSKEFLVRR